MRCEYHSKKSEDNVRNKRRRFKMILDGLGEDDKRSAYKKRKETFKKDFSPQLSQIST
jgi:hypothetical protein